MICFGFIDAVFSLALGKIVEITGRPIMMGCGALVNLALLIFFLLWKPSQSTVYVFYISSALWGFADAVWQTQVNGKLFSSLLYIYICTRTIRVGGEWEWGGE